MQGSTYKEEKDDDREDRKQENVRSDRKKIRGTLTERGKRMDRKIKGKGGRKGEEEGKGVIREGRERRG